VASTADGDAFRAVGAQDRECELSALRNVVLLGPLPAGDPGHQWSAADFAVVGG
jgi:hypothetical protein